MSRPTCLLALLLTASAHASDALDDTGEFRDASSTPTQTFDMLATLTHAASVDFVSVDAPRVSPLFSITRTKSESDLHGYTTKQRARIDWEQLATWRGPSTREGPLEITLGAGAAQQTFQQRYYDRPLAHMVWSGQSPDGSTLTFAINAKGELRARTTGPLGDRWLVAEGRRQYWWHEAEDVDHACAHDAPESQLDTGLVEPREAIHNDTRPLSPQIHAPEALVPARAPRELEQKSFAPPLPPSTSSTIDVIQMFSDGAADDLTPYATGTRRGNATLEAFLNVAYTNHTLANTQLSARIRLLHVDIVPRQMFRDQKSLFEVRNDLREGITQLGRRAHALRDRFGADLVTMHKLPAGPTPWAGIAFVLGIPGVAQNQRGRPRNAYAVLNLNSTLLSRPVIANTMSSYAHELFHLFGATHSRFNGGYIERWRDSNGFFNGGYLDESDYAWHSIMTYGGVCHRECMNNLGPEPVDTGEPLPPPFDREGECRRRCDELPMLSSPNHTVPRATRFDTGADTGLEFSGTPASDNSRVVATTTPFVRDYREAQHESLGNTFDVAGQWLNATTIELSWNDATLPFATANEATLDVLVDSALERANRSSVVTYEVYVGSSLGEDDLVRVPIVTDSTFTGAQSIRIDDTQMDIADGPMFFRVWAGITFNNNFEDSASGTADTATPNHVDVWVHADYRHVAGHWVGCAEDPSLAFISAATDWNRQTCSHGPNDTPVCEVDATGTVISCDLDLGQPVQGKHPIRSVRTPDPLLHYDWLVYGEAGDGQQFCCQYADPAERAQTYMLWGSNAQDVCYFEPEPSMDDWAEVVRSFSPRPLEVQVVTRDGADEIYAHREDALASWVMDGGRGADLLHGSIQDDFLFGGPGTDVLIGHQGDDILVDGGGRGDRLLGGTFPSQPTDGNDILCGFGAGTTYQGGQGNNSVFHDLQAAGPPDRLGSSAGGPSSICGDPSWDTATGTGDTASLRGGWAGICRYTLDDVTPFGVSCALPPLKAFP